MGLHEGSLRSLHSWSAPCLLVIRFLLAHPVSTVSSLEATQRQSGGPPPNQCSSHAEAV